MSGADSLRQPSAGEQSFRNDPAAVITEHLSRVGEPSPGSVQVAAAVIRTSYPDKDALGVCLDLNRLVTDSTSTLAGMFAAQHEAIPRYWQTNPEITRTVLSMSGQIEAGFLRAQRISQAHGGGNPHIDARLAEVEHFVAALQAK